VSWVEEGKLGDLLERIVRENRGIGEKNIITTPPLLPHP
jgi:hypothetical protein